MEKEEKFSTTSNKWNDEVPFYGAKQAFLILHKLRIKRGISVREICAKIDISQSSYSRYMNDFKSQNKCAPKVSVLMRYADALGYEFNIVNKKKYGND